MERGVWMLVTGDSWSKICTWLCRDTAIGQLREEGWSITGPFPELERGGHPKERFYGYAVSRVVH